MKSFTALLALLVTLSPCLCRAVEPWPQFAVWPSTDDQEMPAIYGDTVVWQQFVAEFGDYDIYVADLNEPDDALLLVLGEGSDQMNPAIYENIVVWQDFIVADGGGDWDITGADISDANEAFIFPVSGIEANDEQSPAIAGPYSQVQSPIRRTLTTPSSARILSSTDSFGWVSISIRL